MLQTNWLGLPDGRLAAAELEPLFQAAIAAATPVVAEEEPNDTIEAGQLLDRSLFVVAGNPDLKDDSLPSLTLSGHISDLEDQDFVRVHLEVGEHLYLDIRSWKGPDWKGEGTFFGITDPSGIGQGFVGSTYVMFVAREAGVHSIAVHAPRSNFPDQDPPDSGDYDLHISVGEPLDPTQSALWSGAKWFERDLTYSFPTSSADYADGIFYNDQPNHDFRAFNDSQKAVVREVLQGLSAVTELTFSEAAKASEGVMRFGLNDLMTNAYYPGYDNGAAGDTFYQHAIDFKNMGPGSHAHFVFLHEIGHALGLQHGHETGNYYGPLPPEHDSLEFSLMTYRSYVGDDPNTGTSPADYPQSYMMYDLATLQFLYGPDFTTRAGNTTYRWSPLTGQMTIDGIAQPMPNDNHIFLTVWDGGGEDSYDLSNYTTRVEIDLRPRGWTRTSEAQIADLGDGHYARGNIANAMLYKGDTRSLIENAIGGSAGDAIVGNQAVNGLLGGGGDDTLDGLEADDVLDGGAGDDRLTGGAGTDTASYASAGAAVTVNLALSGSQNTGGAGSDTLSGIENLAGSPLGDTLTGNSGANSLDGAAGADILRGGAGDDVYRISDSGDTVIEDNTSGGVDLVVSAVSFSLVGQYLENLTLSGAAATNATGNGLANLIVGNAAANQLSGGDGADVLNGAAGSDTMAGDAGNDRFVVDNAADRALESSATGGTDAVESSVSFSLAGQYIENLTLTGTAASVANGNGLANVLAGNAAANVLNGAGGADTMSGGGGSDRYFVDASGDRVIEGSATGGIDTVESSVSFSLAGQFVENLALAGTGATAAIGNGLVNALTGNAAGNVLDGGGGADTMSGGGGNDRYVVDTIGDRALESSASGGTDLVESAVSFSLSGQYLENLTLTGTASTATGNGLANGLTGNGAANKLYGGAGNDILRGNGGSDGFYFESTLNASTNLDRILDFSVVDDTILLENAVFTGLAAGALTGGAFCTGTAAGDAGDRIIYNSATGALSFDVDGTGAAAAVQFATLSTGLGLTATDFTVI
jgi:Ca2+-binding RTX toxin-like protein